MGRMIRRPRGLLDGLRERIVLMGVLTAAPLLALLVVAGLLDREQALRSAAERAAALARLGTAEQAETIDEVARTLRLLALVPELRAIAPGACDRRVTEAAARAVAHGTRITIVRPDGVVICSSWREAPHPDLGDRPYFRRALEAGPDAPAAVQMVVSRLTATPVMVVARRLHTEAADGVIVASLGMDWLAQLAARLPGPLRHVAAIIDPASGTVLGRFPHPEGDTAEIRPGPRLRRALAGRTAGSVTMAHWNGMPMVFGFAPLPVGGQTVMLAVGVARQDVLASANQHLRFGVALALA
ncbi:MAG TPA: hypothetical protein VFN46_02455, partial [Acetobacteraceae bacterium]|nr:hypothetical protein [Acetobacteraceae bacterium]